MNLNDANHMVGQFLADARQPEHAHLVDMADIFSAPSPLQVVDAVVEAYPDLTTLDAIDLLEAIDFAALRKGLAK